jgi:hypothetical protein
VRAGLLAFAGVGCLIYGLVALAFNGNLEDCCGPPAHTLGVAIPFLAVAVGCIGAAVALAIRGARRQRMGALIGAGVFPALILLVLLWAALRHG